MSVVVTGVGDKLIEVGKRSSSLLYDLVHLSVDFDDSGEWSVSRSVTAAHWIGLALDVEVCTAREWIRIGRLLKSLPLIDTEFSSGRLSYSKVRYLTRLATPENEAELIALARDVPAGRLRTELAAWSLRHEEPEVRSQRHRRERGLWWSTEPDGSVTGSFCLEPLQAGKLKASVDALVMRRSLDKRNSASADASFASLAQQRADSLVELVSGGGAGVEAEIVLHVRADGCNFDDGTPIAGSVVEGLVPDAFIRTLIHDAEGKPINASGRHRHPTFRQRRVVKERNRTCVDCGISDLLQYDHMPDFSGSRRTIVEELELRCAPCHRARHEREA